MKIQISNGMFMALVINMMYAKAIGVTQGSIAREIGSDMWISSIISFSQGLVIMLLTIFAVKRMPDKNLMEQAEIFLGTWFGKLVALIIFLFFLFGFGGVLATFVFHLKDFFLPDAPVLLFVIVALIMGIYALYFGLEVIGRMALIGVFSILALNILILIGTLDLFKIDNLFPVMLSGPLETAWASRYLNTDWALATVMTCTISSYIKKPENWIKSGGAAMIYGGLFICLWPILEAGVLSSEVTSQYYVACMQLARSAHLGEFLQRYELIMVAFFALSSLTQIMMSLLCASIAMQKIIGVKDYRKVIFPTALILGAFGYYLVLDHHRSMNFLETKWVVISMGISVGLPLLFLLIGFFRKGKLKQAKQETSTL